MIKSSPHYSVLSVVKELIISIYFQFIALTILDVDIEGSPDYHCQYDAVEFYSTECVEPPCEKSELAMIYQLCGRTDRHALEDDVGDMTIVS